MKYLVIALCLSLTACGELTRKCDAPVGGYSTCTTTAVIVEPGVACEGSCKK